MFGDSTEAVVQSLAIDAFNVFGATPEDWPDLVQFNRSGYSDVNVRGIWTFQDRVEFFNVPFGDLGPVPSAENPIHPDSSGDAI